MNELNFKKYRHGKHLKKDVKKRLDEAQDNWKFAKINSSSIDEILDAYFKYQELMRKYVDSNWT